MREVDEEGFAIRPNKTRLKREQAEIRKLVVALMAAGEKEWRGLGLDAGFQKGLLLARGMKASGARNRQIKFLARQLQQNGLEAACAWLENRDLLRAEEHRRFHQLEQWRERLVEEGDGALEAFLEHYPRTDRQHLRQLVRAAMREKNEGKPTGAGKKLFRLLREIATAHGGSAIL
jgi:ribosome-associated protein